MQLAASDAQLRQLAAGQAPTSAAQQLQGTLRRLGLTAGELSRLPTGETVSSDGSAAVLLLPLLVLLLLPRLLPRRVPLEPSLQHLANP